MKNKLAIGVVEPAFWLVVATTGNEILQLISFLLSDSEAGDFEKRIKCNRTLSFDPIALIEHKWSNIVNFFATIKMFQEKTCAKKKLPKPMYNFGY
jgi:hypothetical protein